MVLQLDELRRPPGAEHTVRPVRQTGEQRDEGTDKRGDENEQINLDWPGPYGTNAAPDDLEAPAVRKLVEFWQVALRPPAKTGTRKGAWSGS